MFQLARRPAAAKSEPVRAPAQAPAIAVGKQSLTAHLEAGYLGAADLYTQAIESAQREMNAVRMTALPALVAARRRTDLAPMAKAIEEARAAMRVRYLLGCANKHVHALEAAAVHHDSMVELLRASLERLVAQAIALGAYRDAETERPRRFVDEDAGKPSPNTRGPKATRGKRKVHPPPRTKAPTSISAAPARTRTRIARGTGAPPPPADAPRPIVRFVPPNAHI